LAWPYIWGLVALAAGIVTKSGWGILIGSIIFIVWVYKRSLPLRRHHNDKQRYQGSVVDPKWLSRAIRNAVASFAAAGLSTPNLRNPDGPPITPKVLSHGPCPQGSRWVVELIHGVQHGGDFQARLLNLETAFGRKLIVELSDDPRRVILIWCFTDPLSETRRPDENPFGQ
jgi:hypothetical protein